MSVYRIVYKYMLNEKTKSGFWEKRDRKTSHLCCYILAGGVVLLGLIVVLPVMRQVFNQPQAVEQYCPNPNTQPGIIAPESALSQDSVPSISDAQFQDQISENSNRYGIAAGGGLTYLDQEELDRYFDSLRSLGVRWVRWDVDWSVIQKDGPTSYQWKKTDCVAETARRYGINSLGIITYAPKWASDETCRADKKCAPVDPKTFADFAGEVASRYKGSIMHWEIWNEPNLASLWSPRSDAQMYADVLRESYLKIKQANSSAIVLSGGVSFSGNKKDGGIPPLDFMDSLYASGANQYFDAVSIHPYTFPVSPNYEASPNKWQDISSIRQLMIDNDDEEKKIWITEVGAPTGGPGRAYAANQVNKFRSGSDFMKEDAQSYIMEEALGFFDQNIDWMGPFFWFSLQDASEKRDTTENFFGLLDYKGHKKPAYKVFKKIISSKN